MSNIRSKINRSALAVVLAGGVLATAAPAQAAEPVAVASASVGSADIVVSGQSAQAAPIAPCDVDGRQTNSTTGGFAGNTTKFGRGSTECARDSGGTASAKASGQRFETTVLRQFGGPTLRVRTFSARCNTTSNGSSGYVELSGVSGFSVPREIRSNHTIMIPGRGQGDPPMARLVLNELEVPTPADGSLTTNALRITLFPEGGPASGDIVVGSASCDPYGA
ncbi:hypothetical protein SAMN05216266_105209 [Amycolatopsis marina]|uniref:Secreted protein n=1 Tax=Amycolatopsis marina TaxID=490629 RepID=A0A1I0YNX9_9PSEU|nr:hypothetical protein [Amycolatopsis marina]SFB14637.1 hypothetical protein SAMN05216266_105209 [Amycolatopsis marina]